MYIDCHGHFTSVPQKVRQWRDNQLELFERGERLSSEKLDVTDEDLVAAIEDNQFRFQKERGLDVTLFSPTAGKMAHHFGDQETSLTWSQVSNNIISRVSDLYPTFVGVGQLPQSPGATIDACVQELERCVNELGFVAVNLNPDPSDGYWQAPALTDKYYYPLYEKLVELQVPAMIHSSMSCNPAVHGTCAHYLNGDITAFMQIIDSDLFKDFPDLKLIIPHGGGAAPYHWGRYQGAMQDRNRPRLEEIMGDNLFFDTCVYWKPGLKLLTETVPTSNILHASELLGAVRGIDPETGRHYDDTKYLLESIDTLSKSDLNKIAAENAFRVYPRLKKILADRGLLATQGEK